MAAVAGGVVGGVVAIVLIATAAVFLYRGSRRPSEADAPPQELGGGRPIAELHVQPPELGAERDVMVELPDRQAAREWPSHV